MNQIESRKMVEDLIEEIEIADEQMQPPHEAVEGNVLFVLEDPFLKKMYSIYMLYGKEADITSISLRYSPNDASLKAEQLRAASKTRFVHALFWYLTREKYNLFHVDNLGIREGWKVVDLKDDSIPPSLKKMLEGLFGGQ